MPDIVHEMVGDYHVFTSPDLPVMYVADKDRSVAESRIEPTIAVLRRLAERKDNEARLRSLARAA